MARAAATYRGARRNRVLRQERGMWHGIKPKGSLYRPPVRPNKRDWERLGAPQ